MEPGRTQSDSGHDPVMAREVLEALRLPDRLPDGKRATDTSPLLIVDCTLGRGGHARLIADRLSPADTLVCLDRDPRNLEFARTRFADVRCNVRFFDANFAQLDEVFGEASLPPADGIFADLGISTNQLFEARYGLSFQYDGPLDMRLSPDDPVSAERIINTWAEADIANLIYELADERHSRRIARKIVAARLDQPIQSSARLADIVRSAVPRVPRSSSTESIDPATRTFLALRMKVNREAENLEALLKQAPAHLALNGRLVLISFHSTEDRIVKNRFRDMEAGGLLEVLTKRPLVPDDDEIRRNPRSRSSKMRVAQRN